ncbi:MAG: hypothetical protein AB4368_07485 [Xenococcaceae cyanobacterium]
MHLWNASTQSILSVTFSPDGNYLATAGCINNVV